MLLVVAESFGSSPGRQGYKMAVGVDGRLSGSIGGGVMEVNLVEQSRALLSEPPASAGGFLSEPRAAATRFLPLSQQIHRENSPHASGMICSGKQTVIFKLLDPDSLETVEAIISALDDRQPFILRITHCGFGSEPPQHEAQITDFRFEKTGETDFLFEEKLGYKNDLYIIGGGHCALALSELMSKMDFHIRIFDDRPDLNTVEKNRFAHEKHIVEAYDHIAGLIGSGSNAYVVVMTLGYKSDEIVIRRLIDKDFKYFGVLGSRAKMATMFRKLKADGFTPERLDRIRTPVGIPINSRTPEEIAVSIAAEIIAFKNAQ